ncbi:MAG TPA: hypothetical protein VHT93_02275 [Pseudolabrys sp.]|jgi:hypothetical protein|nr:hypothetical protein [Pseudolabrys sp.]
MTRLRLPLRFAAAASLGLIGSVLLAGSASAHVKWFCAYDIAGQPRVLENVLCPDFEYLIGISILALLSGAVFEGTNIGEALLRAMDRVTHILRNNTELLFRAGCGFFFVAIWGFGGVLLTPELKTSSTAVGVLQLAIAAGMLSRRTMPFSAAGIAIIFGIGIWGYGIFHLADYPIFLGIAAYIALTGLQRDFFGVKALDIVRWSAGVTLMWASIEKWAYPEWTFPLFIEHPGMSFGFDNEFYMRAAGAVEFALAFALMWTPLVRRIGATMLVGMFTSAVIPFGKVDLIGHSLIVVVLLSIIGDSRREVSLVRYPWLLPVSYAAAIVLFLSLYYGGHALLYGTTLT